MRYLLWVYTRVDTRHGGVRWAGGEDKDGRMEKKRWARPTRAPFYHST